MTHRCGFVVCGLLFLCTLVAGQSPAPAAPSTTTHNLNVSSTQAWTDTNIDLHPGDIVRLTATASKGNCSPEGVQAASQEGLPLSAAPPGTLIGRIGSETPFAVGSSKELTVASPGHLYLGANIGAAPACNGEFAVKFEVTGAASDTATMKSKAATAVQTWLSGQFGTGNSPPATSSAVAAPGAPATTSATTPETASSAPAAGPSLSISSTALDPQLSKDLDGLPRRVSDEFKDPGDMVNFVIIGSQEQLKSALTSAGWHIADQTKEAAVANAILQTYQKRDYVQMPMSTLYLFDRPQDFGYEQAEAYAVAASRHHFRLWKAPFEWNGQPVWVGAGTHDIGFEKDQRNGKVTHKIDPAVDAERDHIGSTLEKAGVVKSMSYYLPSDPVKEARNATGGAYHSDGRVLVIVLR